MATVETLPPVQPAKPAVQSRFAEPALLLALASLVGIVGGLGAILFRLMIDWVGVGVHVLLARILPVPLLAQLASPVVGLLLVGVISTYFAREVKGHGVPQILEALALRGGRIRPRVGFFGILAPAITIGSGGSVGREGPIALIGAAFGSSLGQLFKLADRYVMLLVGCGAAAGIGATFNAPIAGALFGMEVVLGSYAMGVLVPCFVSSVVGVTVFNAVMGNHLALPVPPLAFRSPFSVVVMAALGGLAGGVAMAYTKGLTFAEDLFDRFPLRFWQRALIGGLAVGLLGLAFPEVLGVGYQAMSQVATGELVGATVVVLLLTKYVATLTTIGAGGSGGVFAPSLYLGLMLGTSFGALAHGLFPHTLADARVFGVAGMGAVFAGAAQAPLTAAVIVLEMTGAYKLTLGVVMASAISYLVYGSLMRDTMYTVRLTRRGIRILRGAEVRPLERLPVRSAMQPLRVELSVDDPLVKAETSFTKIRADALVVTRTDGTYAGVLELPTLLALLSQPDRPETLHGVSLRRVPPLTPEQSLEDAMRRFALYDIEVLPVVDHRHGDRLLGVITRGDVLRTYQMETALSLETERKRLLLQESRQPGGMETFSLPANHPFVGKTIRELPLPRQAVVVAISRGSETLVPRGDTRLEAGDGLVVYGNPLSALEEVRQLFN